SATFIAAYIAQIIALRPTQTLPWTAWPGVALYAAALGLWAWATQASGRRQLSLAFSRDLPQVLITKGPYQFVRHPFYTAYMLHWFAGVVATIDLTVAVTGVLAAALCVVAAEREERRFAVGELAAEYQAYQGRMGMFIPALGRQRLK